MARARVGERNRVMPAESAVPKNDGMPNGRATPAQTSGGLHERRAYEFRDARGRQAQAWWEPEGWRVRGDDAAFRRRIARALEQPILVWETAVWEDGVPSCIPTQVVPGDARYLRMLPAAWGQLPLDDVEIGVVTVPAEPD